jgi:hypothetical protein
MKYLLIFLFIIPEICFTQNEFTEQIAFNYFMTEIFQNDYPQIKSVYFSGKTKEETKLNLTHLFSDCYRLPNLLRINSNKNTLINKEKFSQLRFLKKARRRTIEISVHQSANNEGYHLVYITIYKPFHYVSHYLIRLEEQTVIDYCFEGEMI